MLLNRVNRHARITDFVVIIFWHQKPFHLWHVSTAWLLADTWIVILVLRLLLLLMLWIWFRVWVSPFGQAFKSLNFSYVRRTETVPSLLFIFVWFPRRSVWGKITFTRISIITGTIVRTCHEDNILFYGGCTIVYLDRASQPGHRLLPPFIFAQSFLIGINTRNAGF